MSNKSDQELLRNLESMDMTVHKYTDPTDVGFLSEFRVIMNAIGYDEGRPLSIVEKAEYLVKFTQELADKGSITNGRMLEIAIVGI